MGIVQAIFDGGYWWQLRVYDDGLRPTIFSGNSQCYFSKCSNCWCIGNFNGKMMINQKFQDEITGENEDKATILWEQNVSSTKSTIWFVLQQNWRFTSLCQMHKIRSTNIFQAVSVPEIGVKFSGFQTPWVKSCTKSREPPLGKSKEHIPDNSTGSYSKTTGSSTWVCAAVYPSGPEDKNVVQVSSVAPFTSTMTSFTYAAKKNENIFSKTFTNPTFTMTLWIIMGLSENRVYSQL